MIRIKPSEIIGKNINLLPIDNITSKKFINDFHDYSRIENFYTFLTYDPFIKLSQSTKYLELLIKRSSQSHTQYWFIYLINERKIIGTIGLLNACTFSKSAEIGYGISPKYWGKGLFNDAAQLLINFISKEYRIRQFFAKTSKLNTNSINALVRLGFTERAMIKNYYHYSDGHFEDAVFMFLNLL